MDKRRIGRGQTFVRKGTHDHYVVASAGPAGVKLRTTTHPMVTLMVRWAQFEYGFEPVADYFRRQAIERKGDAIA